MLSPRFFCPADTPEPEQKPTPNTQGKMEKNNPFIFLFDLDNTLVETNQANNMAYQKAIEKYTYQPFKINKQRFTRKDIPFQFPHFSSKQIEQIVFQKESIYADYLTYTSLNKELFKTLKLLHTIGHKTILLTECRKLRAMQICSYHQLNTLFYQCFYRENYEDGNKYTFLNQIISSNPNIVLFENDEIEIHKAILSGLSENQIITIKF